MEDFAFMQKKINKKGNNFHHTSINIFEIDQSVRLLTRKNT